MSNPTDAELSRVIAVHLGKSMPRSHDAMKFNYSTFRWEYRDDICHDPAMTLLLWKTLIDELDFQQACELIASTQAAIDDGTSEVLQRAVAEAYAISHNLLQEGR